jgi:hypothetical protein
MHFQAIEQVPKRTRVKCAHSLSPGIFCPAISIHFVTGGNTPRHAAVGVKIIKLPLEHVQPHRRVVTGLLSKVLYQVYDLAHLVDALGVFRPQGASCPIGLARSINPNIPLQLLPHGLLDGLQVDKLCMKAPTSPLIANREFLRIRRIALYLPAPDEAGEVLERPVVGCLGLFRKNAAGQLPHLEMIGDAVAADPLSGAWVIGTITPGQVLLFVTFHRVSSFYEIALCRLLIYKP